MRRLIVLLAVGLVGSTAFVLPTFAGPEKSGNKTPGASAPAPCSQQDDDTSVTIDPETIWPPNHRMQPVDVTITDTSGDAVNIAVSGITTNEPDNAEGDGNTTDDVPAVDTSTKSGNGSATSTVYVRAERSGRGVGRSYVITYDGDSSDGSVCEGTLTAVVPHDRGQGAEHKATPGS